MRVPLAVALTLGLLGTPACNRSPEGRSAGYLESGKRYFERKEYAPAIIQFKSAARLAPRDAEPEYQLGLAYLASGDGRQAVLHLRQAGKLNPKHAAAQLKLAELQAAFGESRVVLEQAEKRAGAVLNDSSGDPAALDVLALADLRLGRAEDAEEHLRQALAKFPAHLKSSVMLALARLSAQDLKGAESALKDAVQQAPKSPQPRVALASLYTLTGRDEQAGPELQRALELDPRHGPVLARLAALRFRQGRLDEAERLFGRLSSLPEESYKPLHALFLLQCGKKDAGLAELEALAKANRNDAQARARLVAAYVTTGKLTQAEQALAAALKANPRETEALFQRSALLMLEGKYSEAEQPLTEVLKMRPEMA